MKLKAGAELFFQKRGAELNQEWEEPLYSIIVMMAVIPAIPLLCTAGCQWKKEKNGPVIYGTGKTLDHSKAAAIAVCRYLSNV